MCSAVDKHILNLDANGIPQIDYIIKLERVSLNQIKQQFNSFSKMQLWKDGDLNAIDILEE